MLSAEMPTESMERFGSWIPQAFYDLIGRIVPGIALLTLGYLLLQPIEAAGNSVFRLSQSLRDMPLSLVIIVSLVFAYLTGVLLGALGTFIFEREWRIGDVSNVQFDAPTSEKRTPPIWVMYDTIQYRFPSAGARLAKLSAERHLARVLIVGFVILTVLWGIAKRISWHDGKYWLVIVLLLVGSFLSWLFNRHLRIRSMRLMVNYWHFLKPEARNGSAPESTQQGHQTDAQS
jgi:RsiW-degrading membrane proteinase PrsW (M82 family)